MGGIGGQGGIKIASASTSSVNEGLILVHAVKLMPIIKAKISGRMASIGICDVVTASVYSEKTRLKKCLIMIIMIITKKPFTSK